MGREVWRDRRYRCKCARQAQTRPTCPPSTLHMARSGFGLALAVWLMASTLVPANAWPNDQPDPMAAPNLQAPIKAPTPAREKGQCEIGREWSDARMTEHWPMKARIKGIGALGYIGRLGASTEVDMKEARTQVARVVRVSGLEMNFEMVVDPSTPASAQIVNGRRVILFDPRFMAQVADRICPDWGAMSILAHEVGHHLAGHTLRQTTEPWRDELEADEFSGFVLARLAATLAETTSAAARILPAQETPTHPGRKDRIAAIVHGWQNAAAIIRAEVTQAKHNQMLVPMRQDRFGPVGDGSDATVLALTARIILYDDPTDYYITKSGRIDSFDGTRRPVGKKALPRSSEYAWTFQTEAMRLDVDYTGHIFMQLPSGNVHEVGIVAALEPLSPDGK